MNIAGRSALVTGGASGIGRAACVALARKGAAHVHVLDVNAEGIAETARLLDALDCAATAHVCDVGDLDALEAAFAAAAAATGLDIVFNNAGIVTGADLFPETPVARIERIVAINTTAIFAGTRFAFDHMQGRGGVVVNTGSSAALHTRFRDILYTATKAAVVQFTGACGQLMESHGVRVCAVMPGLVATPIIETTGGDRRADWMEPVLRDNVALTPSVLADAVVALIEDDGNAGEYVIVQAED